MKGGAENRKKTITAGALGAVALCCIVYAYSALFSGSTPAPTPPPVVTTAAPATQPGAAAGTRPATAFQPAGGRGTNAASGSAGVDATKLASTASSLDPTLHEDAMLRTESLVYSGSGRNIFSAAAYVPPPVIPKNMPSARPKTGPALPPAPTGPPPPPPIQLTFFGTAKRGARPVQAFLLAGDDVYLASAGEIVAHKYKILAINVNSIQVEDLQNGNTQLLPLQAQ